MKFKACGAIRTGLGRPFCRPRERCGEGRPAGCEALTSGPNRAP